MRLRKEPFTRRLVCSHTAERRPNIATVSRRQALAALAELGDVVSLEISLVPGGAVQPNMSRARQAASGIRTSTMSANGVTEDTCG